MGRRHGGVRDERHPHEAPRELVPLVGGEGGEHAGDRAVDQRDAADLPARGVPAARVEPGEERAGVARPAGERGVVGRGREEEQLCDRVGRPGGAHDDIHGVIMPCACRASPSPSIPSSAS